MLQSGNYDLVHELFGKMRTSGEVPEALTYKGSVLLLSYHLQLIFGR
jgi:pentatricopeptide repeat protein